MAFTHDCDKCRFLGTRNNCDLYHHPGILGGSLVARFGNEDSEYASMPVKVVQEVQAALITAPTADLSALFAALSLLAWRSPARWG